MAACLPAVFWLAYSAWNTALSTPPALGALTPFTLLYLAMVPGLIVTGVGWQRHRWPGRAVYLVFMAWVIIGLAWYDQTNGVDVPKRLVIYALLGLTAAQFSLGYRRAPVFFAGALLTASAGLAAWTIARAVSSGFAYRGGLPVNPNFVSTLVAPGIIVALAVTFQARQAAVWVSTTALCLVSLYSCLILGSRGVLVALLPALAMVWWRLRPAWPRVVALLAGVSAVVVVAQTPTIPHRVWTRIVLATETTRATSPQSEAIAPGVGATPAGALSTSAPQSTTTGDAPLPPTSPAFAAPTSPSVAPPPVSLPPALTSDAAASTALGRFSEEGVGSFNLRSALWRACLSFAVSAPRALLVGGGLGTSEVLAHAANPSFRNSHHAWLQVLVDFGLIGLVLLGWFHWLLVRRLWRQQGWLAATSLGMIAFWVLSGLTTTVTDLHVYWVSLGVIAGSAAPREGARDAGVS